MDKVIIINGLGGCGKSTFIRLCKDYSESAWKNINIYELSSVDFVKEVATFCGWDGTKTTKNRTFLHNIKVLLEEWDNIPHKKLLEQIKSYNNPTIQNIFFVNIREDYNINSFKAMLKENNLDCITLGVINPNKDTNEVIELINQINEYPYDVIIKNDGDIAYLSTLAKDFMRDLIKGEKV
jgi:hypothetical protein